jgi:ribonuclease VapC
MKRPVLDTSVIMAILLEEPGHDFAARLAPDALMSSVNLAEVMTKCVEKAVPADLALDYLNSSRVEIVPFEAEDAVLSGRLFETIRKGVLSLGDRACIATTIRLGGTAYTADRIWSSLDLPCPVELIR